MNQMVLYSKCMAIRDAQVLEKKNILSEEEERARRWVVGWAGVCLAQVVFLVVGLLAKG
jgi:hypothetical protein